MTSISLQLPAELKRALNDVAVLTHRPKSYLIRKAVELYLAKYSDYEIALGRLRNRNDKILKKAAFKKKLR